MTISLPELEKTLGATAEQLLDAIDKAGVAVLQPLPPDTHLLMERRAGLRGWMNRADRTTVDLSPFDFIQLTGPVVRRVAHKPEELARTIHELVSIDPETGQLAKHRLMDCLDTVYWQAILALGDSQQVLKPALDVSLEQCGRIRKRDVDVVAECLAYSPFSQDAGQFTPSDATTDAIRDMNVAFQLFRVKHSLGSHEKKEARRLVVNWLTRRWNTAERQKHQRREKSPLGDDVLQKAAEVILESNPRLSPGLLVIPENVKNQHHSKAPETLMVAEYLAQCRQKAGSSPLPYGLEKNDFLRNENLLDKLEELRVGPIKYRDLLVRLLSMDVRIG